MTKLECIVSLGMARIDAAVAHAIWKHSTAYELSGEAGGYWTIMAFKPYWPERCPDCDCHLSRLSTEGGV